MIFSYIGQTAIPIDTRVEEHKKQNLLAILEHNREKEPMMIKRKVKEAFRIKCHKPALNCDTRLHLPLIYDHFLSHDCSSHMTTEPFLPPDC